MSWPALVCPSWVGITDSRVSLAAEGGLMRGTSTVQTPGVRRATAAARWAFALVPRTRTWIGKSTAAGTPLRSRPRNACAAGV